MANAFKRGQAVTFTSVGAGKCTKRRGVVARTVDTGRGLRVEVKTEAGVFRPHLSLVRAA